ncbi:MAG: hypothetical protein WCF24_09570 [Acidimicrobiales bacterium]
MHRAPLRVSAVVAMAALVTAVITDLTISSVSAWWTRYSFIGSVVSSVLILAFTVLVVDEVVSRRQVRERNHVAAVQAAIVYGQVLQTAKAVMEPGAANSEDAAGEVRALASMLLTAAPALFDDPEAREFMEQAETFSGMLLRIEVHGAGHKLTDADRAKLTKAKQTLSTAAQPLLARLNARQLMDLEGEAAT